MGKHGHIQGGGGQLIMMGNCPPLRILKEGEEKGLKDERKKEKRGKEFYSFLYPGWGGGIFFRASLALCLEMFRNIMPKICLCLNVCFVQCMHSLITFRIRYSLRMSVARTNNTPLFCLRGRKSVE